MIEIKNLSVNLGDKVVYKNFNLSFEENKITAILGRSGSGKTTLFNVLCNNISFSGEITNNPQKKSMVYSKPRLIPVMTVEENLKFILKENYNSEILREFGLYDAKDLFPDELSSGMAQRVSIIRAFMYSSDLLLMDEPFVNLDISLKYKMIDFFKSLWSKNNRTTIIISHDIDDAIQLADRIIIIDNNSIVLDIENTKNDSIKQKIITVLQSL